MYEARQVPKDENRPPVTQSLYSVTSASSSTVSNSNQQTMPLVEEVTKRTEVVTRRIQELWIAMQDLSKRESLGPCAERIRESVIDLIAIFPSSLTNDVMKNAVRDLNVNTNAIQSECQTLQRALKTESTANVEIYLSQVRNSAYNLAKATKTLVTQFQQ
jgi:G protein-coupled receptor kinase interactor 2